MPPTLSARHLVRNYAYEGYPIPGDTTLYDTRNHIDLENVDLRGGVLAKVLLLSLDPYHRILLDPDFRNRFRAWSNWPLIGYGIVKVMRSNHESFREGDILVGHGKIRHEVYTVIPKDEAEHVTLLKPHEKLPLSVYIGAAGVPGMTAFSGWKEYANAKKGEVVFVSTAAGAVGSMVVQLAKQEGLKVIGSTGSDEKVQFLKELGVDVAFNYNTTDMRNILYQEGPIDIYWDNVGGDTLDAVLENSNPGAKVILCGAIGGYNDQPNPVKNLLHAILNEIKLFPFVGTTLKPKYQAAFEEEVIPKLVDGTFKYREDKVYGLEKAPQALLDLMKGANVGKSIVVVSEE